MQTFKYLLLTILLLIAGSDLHAQGNSVGSPGEVYEVYGMNSDKKDFRQPQISEIPGVRKQFYSASNETLYVEVAPENTSEFEEYMNANGIVCLPKRNCTLQLIEEKLKVELPQDK